jgi:hypothetical protein
MESLREDNLLVAGKRQNRVHTYRQMIDRWHEAGVVCHVGFIIGFPHDTPDRVAEDVRALAEDLTVDQASFFMLTPLPGSRDYRRAVEAGTPMDPDYNNFDSFRAVAPHPLMTAEAWTAAYRDAWTAFYSPDHMRAALRRQNPHTYWGLFKCFLWYRAAMIEGTHPMVTGFVRLKDRRSRRPDWPIEGRRAFVRRRAREISRLAIDYVRLVREMQELWLDTRIRPEEYETGGIVRAFRALGRLHVPRSKASRLFAGWRITRPPTVEARRALTDYWTMTSANVRRWRVWRLNPLAVAWHALRDARQTIVFLSAMAGERF